MLYVKGTVTIKVMEAARNSKNKVISLNIGELTRPALAFNEANWGAKTQEYTEAAMNMNKTRFYEIMEKASEITRTKSMPSNHRLNEPTT
jgi:hypothetical protein